MSESLFDMVRDDPGLADLPVVVISDTPEKSGATLQAPQAEHVLLIPKPFTDAQVARALDQLLYERFLAAVIDGRVDPVQPVFRQNLED